MADHMDIPLLTRSMTGEYGQPPGQEVHQPLEKRPNFRPRQHKRISSKRSMFLHNISGILWLTVAIALLVLNAKEFVLGAGLSCRVSSCYIDPFSENQVLEIQRLEEQNRDILGWLQLVSKALEVWFTYLAGNLVYNLTLRLAADAPIRVEMLTMYAEFVDILHLKGLGTSFVKIARGKRISPTGSSKAPKSKATVLLFLFLVLALCLLANLLGPTSTALVLPTLQHIDVNKQGNTVFDKMFSDNLRMANLPTCSTRDLVDGRYSCAYELAADALDGLLASGAASAQQANYRNATLLPPVLQESHMSFSVNISKDQPIIWTANRQLLREFGDDFLDFYYSTASDYVPLTKYKESNFYNKSLQSILHRQGPTIGESTECYRGAIMNITVSTNRQVRCFYRRLSADWKCIRLGQGWNNNKVASAQFTIEDIYFNQTIGVSIYTTDRAVYIKPSQCNITSPTSCNWDSLFSAAPHPNLRNISENQQTFEYNTKGYDTPIWCSSVAFLGFATYTINPSPMTNIIQLASFEVLDDQALKGAAYNDSTTLFVDPGWNLAAWTVDRGGVVTGARTAASIFIRGIQHLQEDPDGGIWSMGIVQQWMQIQTLSLITYNTTIEDNSVRRSALFAASPRTALTLKSWATLQVWKFNPGTRTYQFGRVVLILCSLCVIGGMFAFVEKSKSLPELVCETLGVDSSGKSSAVAQTGLWSADNVQVQFDRKTHTLSYRSTG